MINIPRNKYLSTAVFISFFSASLSYAQAVNDRVIELDEGLWSHQQTIWIGGVEIPGSEISGTHCLTEAESKLTVLDYSNKLMKGIGEDHQCDISNLSGNGSEVTFNISCTATGTPLTTNLKMRYEYSRQQVNVIGEGTVDGGGQSSPIRIDSKAQFVGSCS